MIYTLHFDAIWRVLWEMAGNGLRVKSIAKVPSGWTVQAHLKKQWEVVHNRHRITGVES